MNIQELHTKAIEYADEAFMKKFNGFPVEAKELFNKALALESQAAYAAKESKIGEPSVSILFKSAASLAMNCDKLIEAEKLICMALYGEPPIEIAEELRNLLEELYFQRHLQLQGVSLNSTELQMVIAGKGIGYGMAKSEIVFDKVNTFEKIAFRTAERKSGKRFRVKGELSKVIKMNFQSYLSVPRAASFAFTLRLGTTSEQLKFEGFDTSIEVIEDIIENIELVNSGDYNALKKKIPDEAYFKNFVGLSKELAPDGNEVNLVGLTITRNGHPKNIQFTRLRGEISYTEPKTNDIVKDENKIIELTGRLFAANEEKSNIRLKVDPKGNFTILVPDGLGDIVKKYWGEVVKIKGTEIRLNTIRLTEIDPA